MNKYIIIGILLSTIITACKNNSPDQNRNNEEEKSAAIVQSSNTKVNGFDMSIINFCQKFVHTNQRLDNFFNLFTYNYFLKGGIIMLVFWWLWFLPVSEGKMEKQRIDILVALFSCFFTVLLTRILVHVLPFRDRPMNNSDLHLVLPYDVLTYDDNSFPSDHAAMLYSISAGLYFISKRWGVLALIYITLFPMFGRVYNCYHYPTDIIAGASIGIVITIIFFKNHPVKKIAKRLLEISRIKPQFFYPVFFFAFYQLTTMFDDVRGIIGFLLGHDV